MDEDHPDISFHIYLLRSSLKLGTVQKAKQIGPRERTSGILSANGQTVLSKGSVRSNFFPMKSWLAHPHHHHINALETILNQSTYMPFVTVSTHVNGARYNKATGTC
ncbi:pannexin-2 [Platysternon megacephalum]|uniref:Pannexin-2 n=1 Tax=Platysternon megacephalum TaxID=55544 RepID=A0A4D9ENN6_9SAUR|nr:pannexin-2 [Platysternon megacephalum]